MGRMFARTTHCGFGAQPTEVPLRSKNICLGGWAPLSRPLNTYCVQGCTDTGSLEELIICGDGNEEEIMEMSKGIRKILVFVNIILLATSKLFGGLHTHYFSLKPK